MLSSKAIRQMFLDFFKSKNHHIVSSAPIVVKNDPTLLFTNAGMNQFKDYFLGNKKPQFARVADTQKCLRVSGKHNDLEEVGVDTYHHTMFEMLGNWSFGDYFKKEAIEWSWELLVNIFKIDKERLYVTIFEGDTKEGLPKDEEAFNEWKKWLPEEKILPGKKKDNFWEMGDTGPCGPCTEIHYDSRSDEERKKTDAKKLVNADDPQVIEIWNNVFIQYNRLKDGSLESLPAKHVDTGMGFERLVRVLQHKQSNYDTDIFSGTIHTIEQITSKQYGFSEAKQDIAFRVLADHIRAICFTIADGQLPSNNGAGYVIRRILRRAVRYYYSYLEYKQPLLFQLVETIAAQFENVFPELFLQKDFVTKVINEEEEAFLKTLEKGLAMLENATGHISGQQAFKLYDTYGFPPDLIKLVASEKKLSVDEKGFELHMQQQKTRSRAATAIDTEDWIVLQENSSNLFNGYHLLEEATHITKYRKIKLKGKPFYQIVLDTTPFYAESGGQVGDTGELIINNVPVKIIDTQKENNLIVHFAESLPENLSGNVTAKVDVEKRKSTAIHHSATHLLHAALRQVLGTHVQQKGSLVNAAHLRFDFSHFAKMSQEEIAKTEAIVNKKIRENIPVVIKQMPKEAAIELGAMALFGEKYSDVVRVVIMDSAYSIELCGGTHAGATGELGFFKIQIETSVAAGVRRIEAVCGKAAENFVNSRFQLIENISETLKNPPDILKHLENILHEHSNFKKRIESFEAAQLDSLKSKLLAKQTTFPIGEGLDGIFIGDIVEVSNADVLKKLCFDIKNNLSSYVIVLAANVNGKAAVAVALDENIIEHKQTDASTIIKQYIAPLIKGGGGGQKTLATAGGQDASNLQKVIEKVKEIL